MRVEHKVHLRVIHPMKGKHYEIINFEEATPYFHVHALITPTNW